MKAALIAVAAAFVAVTGCVSGECKDASPSLLLEIVAPESRTMQSLEVTLELEGRRFRRTYPAGPELLDGRTSLVVDLVPPPAAATPLRIGVRGRDALGAIAEGGLETTVEPNGCNTFRVALDPPRVADAGGEDAAEIEDAFSGADAERVADGAANVADAGFAADAAPIADAGFAPDAAAIDAGPIRRVITVNNGANPLTLGNYPVPVVLDTARLIAEGKLQADGDDLRFYDGSGAPLDYWIGAGIGTASTAIWVEVPSIPGGGTTTIELRYRDPAATAASNGEATFLFFADFDASPLGDDGTQEGLSSLSGVWSVVSPGRRGRGFEEVGTANRQSVLAGLSGSDVAVSVGVRLPPAVSGGVNGLYVRAVDLDNLYFFGPFQQNGVTFGKYVGGAYTAIREIVTPVQREVWHEITLAASGTTFRGYLDGALVISASDPSFANGQIGLRTWGTNVRYDDLRVREYRPPEPTLTLGPEL